MGLKLKNYFEYSHGTDEYRKLFYNMSRTMKYVHDRDYYIKTFNLEEIEILNLEKLNPIQYNTVIQMGEYSKERQHEDIYNLAFMQIGIYSDTLNVLNPEFLKQNFESFIPFLPEEDVPYFRGIVTRGANVYYSDFIDQLSKRQSEQLKSEIGEGSSNSIGYQKAKSTDIGRSFSDRDTNRLYSDINNQTSGFVGLLIFPMIIAILGIILGIVIQFS